MKLFATTTLSFSLLASASAQTQQQNPQAISITRAGAQPATSGPANHFTGSVSMDTAFQAKAPARAGGARVSFTPAARTNWHTHPLGQTLIVTAGTGRVQRWGHPAEEIRIGDVVQIPPGEKHWHGAAPTTAMTHIAIAESLNGKAVDWLEHVSDAQYAAPPTQTNASAQIKPNTSGVSKHEPRTRQGTYRRAKSDWRLLAQNGRTHR